MIGVLIAKSKLTSAFDALNRHDLPQFMSAWRDDATFVYPGEIPESGIFEGKKAIEEWFRRFFEQFPTIQFDIQEICVRNTLDFRGSNVAAVHWNLHLKNQVGRIGKNSGVTVLRINGGKALYVKDFIFDLGENFRANWGAPVREAVHAVFALTAEPSAKA